MSFGENLQFLRKRDNMTQEQLAELLEVSRQSVSKWESGSSYPEMDKILQICSMFHCSMDTLMQGDISRKFAEDVHGYDRFYDQFGKLITAGVGLILCGISVMCLLNGMGMDEIVCTTAFFIFLIVAVIIFVVMGMQNERFRQKHPVIEDFYTDDEKEQAYRKYTVRIASGIGLILIAVLLFIVADESVESQVTDGALQVRLEEFMSGIFILMIDVAVMTLVYGGMQKSKYDIMEYNKEANPSPARKKRNTLLGKICGCIMLVATIIYLVWSFAGWAWAISWVVYAVAGIGCAIAAVVLSKEDD